MPSESNQQLRLGSFSNEPWAQYLDASEWMVRMIITVQGDGAPLDFYKINSGLQRLLRLIIIIHGKRSFYFTLGASVKLREWLEAEAEAGRLEVNFHGSEPRYKLSQFMNGVLNARRDEIWQLLKAATGELENLPTLFGA